ncbi:precorrin-6A synthase (deacetylating) [Rubrimonas cliftonensis]|uniref:Precorrin-6A synthase [deacetylating] n=1 Tax=Rubrimonas cliftonensis TaxID=89524 RepID=A0A1H4FWT8_9RHOB|nr:precorrin-6A synthase (deacetylating) [Rubrimonas cliftonensis]SEB01774.1 precorrin-6A synthase (deacetylating) [Rubrimonas cliftonensis]
MRELVLVGIGTGAPGHLTDDGRDALTRADVVLLPRKGSDKAALAELRVALLRSIGSSARIAPFDMPNRNEILPYEERVERWHDAIAAVWAEALRVAKPQGAVALMVWGDPGLYDSTLRIAARLDPVPRLRVIPGITALQALTAAHAIPFNSVAGSVLVTTGRRLRTEGWPANAETVAVMLDGDGAFAALPDQGLHIWWGAYLGMTEQILDAGPIAEAAPRIASARAAARLRHGWIMDTYLLRRGA